MGWGILMSEIKTNENLIESEEIKLANDLAIDYTKEYSDEFYSNIILNFKQNKKRKLFFRFVKRSFDFFASLLGLIILSPIFIIFAIAIKIESRGPVFFKQKRIGRHGKEFVCLKFRSMRIDAPKNCATSLLENPEQYITKVGKFMRKFSIDELPQLFCTLIGTMSIIGYRPLVVTEEKCNGMRLALGVLAMRPGISGYAQVHGRDDVYYKNKAVMDAYYVKNASIWFDIKLMFQTVACVFTRRGNNSEKQAKKQAKKTKKQAEKEND